MSTYKLEQFLASVILAVFGSLFIFLLSLNERV